MADLPCVIVEPELPARAAIVWLHGLGADGHDFEPLVPELRLPRSLAVRFVFPTAPTIPITINGGMPMPAWYDILDMSFERRVDQRQLLGSAAAVTDLVGREIERGIDSRAIVVAGFSQGGAIALHVALSYPAPLAGVLALSTYFATAESVAPHPANAGLRALVAHGTLDPVVPEARGRQVHDRLAKMGYRSEYRSYRMEHGVCAEEVADISRWLQNVLPAPQ